MAASRKNIDIDFFKFNIEQIPVKGGRLLLAQPTLVDPFFKRSVVLIVETDEKGAMGFILNRHLKIGLDELLPNFPSVDVIVSVGGPVGSEEVNFIHTLGNSIPNSYDLGNGLYMNGDVEALKSLAIAGKINNQNFRVFVGYSGWGEGQLQKEIEENSWVVAAFDSKLVVQGVYDNWYFAVQQLGNRFKAWSLYPENPALN